MDRSLWAVLAGTFTLRFSTGLTGAMLGAYLATLPSHGGEPVSPVVVGLFSATFYLAELVLSPIFGILSDRQGHHRVMLYGPAFGVIPLVLLFEFLVRSFPYQFNVVLGAIFILIVFFLPTGVIGLLEQTGTRLLRIAPRRTAP